MNFELSNEAVEIGHEIDRILQARGGLKGARAVVDGECAYDAELWQELGRLGWLVGDLGEDQGGIGLGIESTCVIAEALGRSLAAVPYAMTIGVALPLLAEYTTGEVRSQLEGILEGNKVAAFLDLARTPSRVHAGVRLKDATVELVDAPVVGGAIADLLFVIAQDDEDGKRRAAVIDLSTVDVERRSLPAIDPLFGRATLSTQGIDLCGNAPLMLDTASAATLAARVDVLMAFEQLGGSTACMLQARDFALQRKTFGRQIGTYQAIKHKLARMFILNELARSNCYYALWAASAKSPQLEMAAAAARLSATRAFAFTSREAMAIHGGMGFTWEVDSHLFLRRAKAIELAGGTTQYWAKSVMDRVDGLQGAG